MNGGEDSSSPSRIKDLLVEAVELPLEERAALLNRLAAADPELHDQLVELLAAWEHATSILRAPEGTPLGPALAGFASPASGAVGHGTAAGGIEHEGDRIGRYLLGPTIGEGGFGVVYRAHQERPVQRDIALKVLKPGMDSRAVLTRFDAERQALARLTHPSIARIFDAGTTPSGRPYFAMELVDGEPITKYCDRRGLSIRERMRLFVDVCAAVQHAHQKGIIHRDLKPSNVLVTETDGEPAVKVIDFGIAKAIDEPLTDVSMITLAQQIIGTPRYMSPEQASLDAGAIDTRSDVYSLGVMLYELLCGSTPLTADEASRIGIAGLSRRLADGRFPRPSVRLRDVGLEATGIALARHTDVDRLVRTLAGDPDWIAMRAIESEPDRRYATAFALGRDIERYLNDEPTEARAPTGMYVLRKFVRRHRAPVAAAVAVLFALLLGLATALWGLDRAETQRIAAEEALDFANLARIVAERSRDDAERSRDEAEAARQEAERSREEALQARDDADRARIDAERALANATAVVDFMNRLFASIDPTNQGFDVKVTDILADAAEDLHSNDDMSPQAQARLHHIIGDAWWQLGRFAEAESHFAEAIEIRKEIFGPADVATLMAQVNLGMLLHEQGRSLEALEYVEPAVQMLDATKGERDIITIGALGNYALVLNNLSRTDEALAIEKRVVALREEISGPDHPQTVGALHNYANSLTDAGRYDDAERVFKDALERGERALGPLAPETVLARSSLANFYHQMNRNEEAKPLLWQVYQERREIYGENHPTTLLSIYNYGANAIQMEDWERALDAMLTVLEAIPQYLPAAHEVSTATYLNLTKIYGAIGWDRASDDFKQHLEQLIAQVAEVRLGPNVLNDLAYALVDMPPRSEERLRLAERLTRRAVETGEALGDPFLYGYLDSRAYVLTLAGRYEEAIATARRALELVPPGRPDHQAAVKGTLDAAVAARDATNLAPDDAIPGDDTELPVLPDPSAEETEPGDREPTAPATTATTRATP